MEQPCQAWESSTTCTISMVGCGGYCNLLVRLLHKRTQLGTVRRPTRSASLIWPPVGLTRETTRFSDPIKVILVWSGLISLSACSSLSTHPPAITEKPVDRDRTPSPQVQGLTWVLDNLNPIETAVLIDGKPAPISIDLKLTGLAGSDNKYVLQLSTTKLHFHPFEVETIGVSGGLDFAGTVTWYLDVSGKREKVAITLYRVDRSESNQTLNRTLVQEISRSYQVICDEKNLPFILALRSYFGLCERRE